MNNDENELDLTNFVPPPLTRKPPTQHSSKDWVFRQEEKCFLIDRHSSQTRDSETRSSSAVRSNRNPSPSKTEQISDDVG